MRLVHRRSFPVEHYVLVDDLGTLAPERLVAEARRRAEALAIRTTGCAQNFTLIHNGSGVARRERPHVHIVCARSRLHKAMIYLLIGLRNLLPRGPGRIPPAPRLAILAPVDKDFGAEMSTRQPGGGEGAARFRALLRDRIAEIEGTWRDWRAAPERVGTMHQLRAVVHRLAGSAAANHIAEIGRPAQRLDALLSGWQDEEVELRTTPVELAAAADPVVHALLEAMAHAAALGIAEPPEHAPTATDFGVPIRVLFLEDDAEQRATWATALEREGLRVRVATDETEFEALLALERPDVLLIDYWLGERTAAEVAHGLRGSREYADIPRVCLTIDSGVQPRQSAMEAGYAAVLRKSIEPADLARVLRQAVANASRT